MLVKGIQDLNLKLETGISKVSDDAELALWTDSGRITTYLDALNNESPRDVKSFLTEKMSTGYRTISDFVAERVTAFNGYFENVFAKKVHSEQICLKKSDGSEYCVNGDQLESIMGSAGTVVSGGGTPSGGSTAPGDNTTGDSSTTPGDTSTGDTTDSGDTTDQVTDTSGTETSASGDATTSTTDTSTGDSGNTLPTE
jgi:hypothetical protein